MTFDRVRGVGILGIFAILTHRSLFSSCNDASLKSLGRTSSGLFLTDEEGNVLTFAAPGSTVYLRDSSRNVIISFTVEEDVDLSDIVAGRTGKVSFAYFATKTGISGDVTLFIPCAPTSNTVYITPGAKSASDVSTDGKAHGVITLTISEPGPVGGYRFVNASNRNGNEDCQVRADISIFDIGGAADRLSSVPDPAPTPTPTSGPGTPTPTPTSVPTATPTLQSFHLLQHPRRFLRFRQRRHIYRRLHQSLFSPQPRQLLNRRPNQHPSPRLSRLRRQRQIQHLRPMTV